MSQKNTLFNYFVSPARNSSPKTDGNITPKSVLDRNPKAPQTPKGQQTPKTPQTPKTSKNPRNSLSATKSGNKSNTSKTSGLKIGSSSKIHSNYAFQICDVVWSKLSGYPWWPSLICNHPKLLEFTKGDKIHVQFFDEPPTRAWVKKAFVDVYKNAADKCAPSKDISKWKKATEEADNAVQLPREDREKLIVAFPEEDASDEDDEDPSIEIDGSDDEKPLNTSGDSECDNKENQEEPPLKKLLLEAEDSEDDYKPGEEDMEVVSESASSGIDSQEESFNGEDPDESPVKRKKNFKKSNRTAKKLKLDSGKSAPTSNKQASSLSKDSAPKDVESKPQGFHNDWAHLKYEFLKPHKIRDANRRFPSDPEYDARTLYVPEDFKKNLTPAMKQWWDIKSQNFDCVLFFKVGKFYEFYHMDAVIGVNELGLLFMKGDFAHSGFPEISYSRFSSSLVEKGYKVARVEQTETPDMMAERLKGAFKATKYDKVVKREVCQITTKGTRICSVIDGEAQEASAHYLLALVEKEFDSGRSSYGVCFIDTSIGIFHVGQFNDDKYRSQLRMLIAHYPPVQVIYSKKICTEQTLQLLNNVLTTVMKESVSKSELWSADKTLMNLAEGEYFPKKDSGGVGWPESLKPFLSETDALGLSSRDEYSLGISALGLVTCYLKKGYLDHKLLAMGQFEQYDPASASQAVEKLSAEQITAQYMILDGTTLRNLDILESSGGQEGSLLHRLDFCSTKFGRRLLREWVCSPLCNISSIKSRQEAISDLQKYPSLVKEVTETLTKLPDLERLLASIHAQGNVVVSKSHPDSRAIFYEGQKYSQRKIQNFTATLNGFRLSSELIGLFQDDEVQLTSKLLLQCVRTVDKDFGKFPILDDSLSYFYSAFNHETASKEGKIVPKDGVDPEYDSVVDEIKCIKGKLDNYLEEQRKFFGCKVTYIGTDKKRFQLEVPETASRKAGNEYELQSQRKGFKRFATPKTKDLLAKLIQVEDQKKSVLQDLSRRIFEQFSVKYELWSSAIKCLSVLDVLLSLTLYVEKNINICVPQFEKSEKPFVKIMDGQHPCMMDKVEGLVSNNTFIGCNTSIEKCSNLMLLTGPNMGGKSTLMRQVGLLTIMAHIGCHVPATECCLSPVDRIFTRIGASDDIMAGESTFFVELSETSAILCQGSKHSLVLVDELGRGTTTHDGTAIAVATVQELVKLGCRTIFSTHYHSLVEDFKDSPYVTLRHMACDVKEDNEDPSQEAVTFLYKLEAGACPKSYGFNAARLGGIPSFITSRAYVKAKEIEEQSKHHKLFRSVWKATESSIFENLKELNKSL